MDELSPDEALAREQGWLDKAHEFLEAMQQRTALAVAASDRAVTQENTADARVAQWHLRRREAGLVGGAGPIAFGKIIEETDETWYVGRRHIEDPDGAPVVIDWRAPVSAPFYRATAIDPCGLVHRRRFSIEGTQLAAIFDEDLTDPESGGSAGLPDPLLAELDRSRSGQMRDIVATIASEQDVIIRADREELLIVQGGPGTGKTAVGLHRAAYLLFRHRLEFAEQKVLVVGPNRLFLRYIAEVLPSLGETSVVQTTAPGLLAGKFPVRATEEEASSVVKGDARMVSVIDCFLSNRIKSPDEGLEVRSGVSIIRFSADEVAELQKTARSRNLPLNDGREVFRQILIQEAWRRHQQRVGSDPGAQPSFTAAIRNDSVFRKDMDRMWPLFSPPVVVRELYASVRKLAAAADGILSEQEMVLLKRSPSKKVGQELWTEADMGILDEAVARISGVPTTYGHLVLDEAQDQSAMSLRMLGRRAKAHSMTILGDLAQATAPVAVGSWEATIDALTGGNTGANTVEARVRIAELKVGYRVPASILDVANRLLVEVAPEVTPARSVRPGGAPPLVVRTEEAGKGEAVVVELLALKNPEAGASERATKVAQSIAVIGVSRDLDQVEVALKNYSDRLIAGAGQITDESMRLDSVRVGRAGLPGAEAIALVEPGQVKGLEFDAVIVVEPAAIMEVGASASDSDQHSGQSMAGGRNLYVSLTRAVQHLGLVHSRDLPPLLALEPQ